MILEVCCHFSNEVITLFLFGIQSNAHDQLSCEVDQEVTLSCQVLALLSPLVLTLLA